MPGGRRVCVRPMAQVPSMTRRTGVDIQPQVALSFAHLVGHLRTGPTALGQAEAHPADRTRRRLRRPALHLFQVAFNLRPLPRAFRHDRVRHQMIAGVFQSLRFCDGLVRAPPHLSAPAAREAGQLLFEAGSHLAVTAACEHRLDAGSLKNEREPDNLPPRLSHGRPPARCRCTTHRGPHCAEEAGAKDQPCWRARRRDQSARQELR